MKSRYLLALAVGLLTTTPAAAQIATTASNDGTALATALQGSGVTFTSATLATNTENGTFTGGLPGVGINSGVVLTTGNLSCVGSQNNLTGCGGGGSSASLELSFVATSSSLFFNYVFASEEYNEYVGSAYNDSFSLILDGANYSAVNLAQVPNNGGEVSINNVNSGINANYFRNNSGTGSLNLPIEFDGLTTLLTASATNLLVGSAYTLTFNISDVGDTSLDSAVFIQGGSIGVVTPPTAEAAVPEPESWAMMILGLGIVGGTMRRRRSPALAMA